jgi:hypothetical protein
LLSSSLPVALVHSTLSCTFTPLRVREILLPMMVASAVCHWSPGLETNLSGALKL